MDLFEAISKRHSYRAEFTGTRISREHLRSIVQAGIDAPTACNAQTVTFMIVDEPDLVKQIGEIIQKDFVRDAPALIVCLADHRAVYREMSFAAEDCAAAVENMLLAITALRYASVWLQGALCVEGRAGRIAALLGAPADREVRVLLPVGVPKAKGSPRKKLPFGERVWFNRYGE